jgi:transcriptional repressor NrdR
VNCPACGSDRTRVPDSRALKRTNSIRRRRVCLACSHMFTTYELTREDIAQMFRNSAELRGKILAALETE